MSWMVENCIWSLVPFPRAVVYSKAVNKGLFFQRLQSGVGNSIEFPIFAYLKKGFMSVTTIRLGHSSTNKQALSRAHDTANAPPFCWRVPTFTFTDEV